jgi:hypothetical protein
LGAREISHNVLDVMPTAGAILHSGTSARWEESGTRSTLYTCRKWYQTCLNTSNHFSIDDAYHEWLHPRRGHKERCEFVDPDRETWYYPHASF